LEQVIWTLVSGRTKVRIFAANPRTIIAIVVEVDFALPRGGIRRFIHGRLVIRSAEMPLNVGWLLRPIQILGKDRAGEGRRNDSDSAECSNNHRVSHFVVVNPSPERFLTRTICNCLNTFRNKDSNRSEARSSNAPDFVIDA
jgi:hypothetical protein